MESCSKYPNESFLIQTDFTNVLGTNETITAGSSSVKVYQDNEAETDCSSTMVASGSVTVSGNNLKARLQAGTETTNYFIKFIAVTSASNTFTHIVRLYVKREIA